MDIPPFTFRPQCNPLLQKEMLTADTSTNTALAHSNVTSAQLHSTYTKIGTNLTTLPPILPKVTHKPPSIRHYLYTHSCYPSPDIAHQSVTLTHPGIISKTKVLPSIPSDVPYQLLLLPQLVPNDMSASPFTLSTISWMHLAHHRDTATALISVSISDQIQPTLGGRLRSISSGSALWSPVLENLFVSCPFSGFLCAYFSAIFWTEQMQIF